MNYFLDLVYSLMVHPRVALRAITRGEQWIVAGLIYLFTILIMSLSSLVEGPGVVLSFLLCLFIEMTLLLLHSASIHYVAGWLGGRGSAKGITSGFMATVCPLSILVFSALADSFSLDVIAGIISCVAIVWHFILNIIAVSENYGFTWGNRPGFAYSYSSSGFYQYQYYGNRYDYRCFCFNEYGYINRIKNGIGFKRNTDLLLIMV